MGQCLGLGVLVFFAVSGMWANGNIGIAITLAGGAWYAFVEMAGKKERRGEKLEEGEGQAEEEVSVKVS